MTRLSETYVDCRQAYVGTLEELAAADPRIVAAVNDSVGSSKLTGFRKRFPDRLVNVGIAEQLRFDQRFTVAEHVDEPVRDSQPRLPAALDGADDSHGDPALFRSGTHERIDLVRRRSGQQPVQHPGREGVVLHCRQRHLCRQPRHLQHRDHHLQRPDHLSQPASRPGSDEHHDQRSDGTLRGPPDVYR